MVHFGLLMVILDFIHLLSKSLSRAGKVERAYCIFLVVAPRIVTLIKSKDKVKYDFFISTYLTPGTLARLWTWGLVIQSFDK